MSDQSTKICKYCKSSIPLKAVKCPSCQSNLQGFFGKHPVISAMLFVLLLPIFSSIISPTSSTSDQSVEKVASTETKITSARIIAKSYIESVPLKSPSTADYHRPTVTQDTKDSNIFNVESYLDSQNGFGAMIRTYWSMKLQYTGSDTIKDVETDSNWKIKEFVFDGEKVK